MKHDWRAKHPFPIEILLIFFSCKNTSLNNILTKSGMVVYLKVLFLFVEKLFHVHVLSRIIGVVKKRSLDQLLQRPISRVLVLN